MKRLGIGVEWGEGEGGGSKEVLVLSPVFSAPFLFVRIAIFFALHEMI